MTIVTKK